jgi:hypothetical protein
MAGPPQPLKDDLPAEVEDRLYIQLRRFQEQTDKQKKGILNIEGLLKNIFTGDIGNLKWGLRQQLVKSAALVFASVSFVILLVTAGFVPITNSRNLLAESLSTLTTSINVSEQLSRANGMECTVESVTAKGDRLNYSIKWTPNQTLVQAIKPDNSIIKTLEIVNDRVTILDHTTNSHHYANNLGQVNDPLFQPIMDFISPAHLQERMQMKWKPGIYRQRGDCDEGIFTVLNSQEKADMEIMVDMCTFLPMTMTSHRPVPTFPGKERDGVIKVQFAWETPPSLPRLIEHRS